MGYIGYSCWTGYVHWILLLDKVRTLGMAGGQGTLGTAAGQGTVDMAAVSAGLKMVVATTVVHMYSAQMGKAIVNWLC